MWARRVFARVLVGALLLSLGLQAIRAEPASGQAQEAEGQGIPQVSLPSHVMSVHSTR